MISNTFMMLGNMKSSSTHTKSSKIVNIDPNWWNFIENYCTVCDLENRFKIIIRLLNLDIGNSKTCNKDQHGRPQQMSETNKTTWWFFSSVAWFKFTTSKILGHEQMKKKRAKNNDPS